MRASVLAFPFLLVACAHRPPTTPSSPPNVPTPRPPLEANGVLPGSSAASDILEAEEEEEDNLDVLECPKHFETADRSKCHEIEGERYYVDSNGRPSKAEAFFPPIQADERATGCQGKVGTW